MNDYTVAIIVVVVSSIVSAITSSIVIMLLDKISFRKKVMLSALACLVVALGIVFAKFVVIPWLL